MFHTILFQLYLFSSKLTIQIKNARPICVVTHKKSNPLRLLLTIIFPRHFLIPMTGNHLDKFNPEILLFRFFYAINFFSEPQYHQTIQLTTNAIPHSSPIMIIHIPGIPHYFVKPSHIEAVGLPGCLGAFLMF